MYEEKFNPELKVFDYCDLPRFKFKDWFASVQTAHNGLREKLGGVDVSFSIETKDKNGRCSLSTAEEFYNNFSKMSYRFRDYVLEPNELCSPVIQRQGRLGFKTTKTISGFSNNYLNGSSRKDAEKLLSQLCDKWKMQASRKEKLDVEIKTSAEGFLQLGHNVIDHMSCFGKDGCNQNHKIAIGLVKDSFVAILKKGKENVGRFWGFCDLEKDRYNISNFYFAKGFFEGTATNAMRGVFAHLMDIEEEDVHLMEDAVTSDTGRPYVNNYGNFSFSREKIDDKANINVSTAILNKYL